jgi:hypothetical protein
MVELVPDLVHVVEHLPDLAPRLAPRYLLQHLPDLVASTPPHLLHHTHTFYLRLYVYMKYIISSDIYI